MIRKVTQSSAASFSTIQTPLGTSPAADSSADTLTFASADGTVKITGNATTDTIDFSIGLTSPTFTSVAIASFLAGSVVFAGSSGVLSQNNNKFFWDDTNISLVVNSKESLQLGSSNIVSVIQDTDSNRASFLGIAYQNPSFVVLASSNGTEASPSATINGDFLASQAIYGNDGAGFLPGGYMSWGVTDTVSPGFMPTTFYLSLGNTVNTTPDLAVAIATGTMGVAFFLVDVAIDTLSTDRLVTTGVTNTLESVNFTGDGQLLIGKSTGGYSKNTLTAGTGVTISNTVGNITISVTSGTYAPIGANYVTIGNTSGLSNERALTGTANQITVTDGGANGNVTLSLPTNLVLPGSITGSSYTTDRVLFTTTAGAITTSGNFKWTSASNQLVISGAGASILLGFVKIDIQDSFTYCTAANVGIYRPNGTSKEFKFYNGTAATTANKRWSIFVDNTAETGSDAGSNFRFNAYSDTGAFIDSPMQIYRAAGVGVVFTRNVQFNGYGVWLVYARTPIVYGSTVAGGQLQLYGTTNASKGFVQAELGLRVDGTTNYVKVGAITAPTKTLDVAGEILSSSHVYVGSETGSSQVMIRMNRYFGTEAATSGLANKISLFNSGAGNDPIYGFGVSSGSLDYVSSSLHKWYSGTTNVLQMGTTSFALAAAFSCSVTTSGTGNIHTFNATSTATTSTNVGLRVNIIPTTASSSTGTYVGFGPSPVLTSIGGDITGGVWGTLTSTGIPPNTFTITTHGAHWVTLNRNVSGGTVTTMYGYYVSQGTNTAGTVTTAYGIRIGSLTLATTNWHLAVDSGNSYFAGSTSFGSSSTPTKTVDITGTLAATGAVTFTNTTATTSASTGALVVSGGAAFAKAIWAVNRITIDDVSGTNRGMNITTSGVVRWGVLAGSTAESGSNTGSPFVINALDDSGSYIDSPFAIIRASGGLISLSRPVDISGAVTLTDKITKYNNVNTAAAGVASIVATSNLTTQAAAIAATTIYAVPASGAGLYRISWVATVTRAATTSCVLGGTNGFQLKFTDNNDSVVKTSNPTATNWMTSATNATGTTVSGVLTAYCKASTNLQYLFDYTSVGATTMQYDLSIRVEYLG